jgi:anti-anti-sigma factor
MAIRMKITTEIKDKFVLINVKGTLSIENISPFETLLNKYVDEKKHILINLSEMTFIDSSSLGIIVVYYTKSEKNNKHFSLIDINDDIMQMFKITGLDKRIKLFDNLDSAIKNLDLSI